VKLPVAGLLAISAQEIDRLEAELAAFGPAPLAAAPARPAPPPRSQQGDVAVIPLRGFMTQRPSWLGALSLGTSTETFADAVVNAMEAPAIKAVVLDVDSGGGSAFGVTEAAARIRGARGSKPLIAVANPVMGSAAYHLASQADSIAASPSAIVGSIGAFTVHVDQSGALAREGLRVTGVSFGRRKLERAPWVALNDEARAQLQEEVDAFGEAMVRDIAAGRRVSAERVRAGYGEGAVFTAERARTAGLVDRIAPLDQVVAGLERGFKLSIETRLWAEAVLAGIPWPKPQRPAERREFDAIKLRARAALAGVKPAELGYDPAHEGRPVRARGHQARLRALAALAGLSIDRR
jgi:signal peptide peptidase SppA